MLVKCQGGARDGPGVGSEGLCIIFVLVRCESGLDEGEDVGVGGRGRDVEGRRDY